jgi:hypothetical protein
MSPVVPPMLTQLADALPILERDRRDLAAHCIGIAGSDTSIVAQRFVSR